MEYIERKLYLQQLIESKDNGEINYPALKVQGFVCRMRMGRE